MNGLEAQTDTSRPRPDHPAWRRAFRKSLQTHRKRAQRKREKIAQEQVDVQGAEELLQAGEILKANLAQIRRGMSEITLPDLYHAGQERTITLDPCLNALQNAKQYFKRHRKLVDGASHIEEQLAATDARIESIDALLDAYLAWDEEAPAEAELPEEFAQDAEGLRISLPEGLRAEGRAKVTREPSREERVARIFPTVDGLKILVGRGARQNDELTFKVGRGSDWWYHVAHVPGSHVLIRGWQPGGKEKNGRRERERRNQPPPPEAVLDAAHLAVHFSKMRDATRADVTCAQVKNLRKRKGAPAGQVIVNDSKTMHLRIEKTRLERLLKGGTPA